MNELLQWLDGMKEMQLVRFFSQFFTEERLSPLFETYRERVTQDPAGLAGELLLWAVLLAVAAFAADQAFYWTQPGRAEQARESWFNFREGAGRAYDGAKAFVVGLAGRIRGREKPRGRR